jgi:hypothetical protein
VESRHSRIPSRCFGGESPNAGKPESGTWGFPTAAFWACIRIRTQDYGGSTAHAPDSATCERHLHVILTSHLPGRADAGVGQNPQSPRAPRAALGPNPGLGAAGNDTMPPCVGWDAVPSTSFLRLHRFSPGPLTSEIAHYYLACRMRQTSIIASLFPPRLIPSLPACNRRLLLLSAAQYKVRARSL